MSDASDKTFDREEELNALVVSLARELEAEYGVDFDNAWEKLNGLIYVMIEQMFDQAAYEHAMDND